MRRWQLTFSRGEELKFIGHLDLARAWERVMRRANLPLAFTGGFRPHPKLLFVAPLPVGLTAAEEMLDLTLDEDLPADALAALIAAQLPAGLRLVSLCPLEGPTLPSRLRGAVYRAATTESPTTEDLERRVAEILAATTLLRSRKKEREVKHYDLRPLILDLWLEREGDEHIVVMRLKADHNGAGRPDEVLDALGVGGEVGWIERSELVLEPLAVTA